VFPYRRRISTPRGQGIPTQRPPPCLRSVTCGRCVGICPDRYIAPKSPRKPFRMGLAVSVLLPAGTRYQKRNAFATRHHQRRPHAIGAAAVVRAPSAAGAAVCAPSSRYTRGLYVVMFASFAVNEMNAI